MPRSVFGAALTASLFAILAVPAQAQVGNIRPLLDLANSFQVPAPPLPVIPNPSIPDAPLSTPVPVSLPIGLPLPLPAEVRGPILLPGAPSLPGLDALAGAYVDFDGELPSPPSGGAPGLPALGLPDVTVLPDIPGAAGLPELPLPGPGPTGMPTLPDIALPAPLLSVTGVLGDAGAPGH